MLVAGHGGGGGLAAVRRPAGSTIGRGEDSYAIRTTRRSCWGQSRDDGADGEVSPRARHTDSDGEVRHAVTFRENGMASRSENTGARKPRPKTLQTLVRRKKEGTSVEHWSLRPWRAWWSTLGVPVRSDPLGR
jgi:hypothetical protein